MKKRSLLLLSLGITFFPFFVMSMNGPICEFHTVQESPCCCFQCPSNIEPANFRQSLSCFGRFATEDGDFICMNCAMHLEPRKELFTSGEHGAHLAGVATSFVDQSDECDPADIVNFVEEVVGKLAQTSLDEQLPEKVVPRTYEQTDLDGFDDETLIPDAKNLRRECWAWRQKGRAGK